MDSKTNTALTAQELALYLGCEMKADALNGEFTTGTVREFHPESGRVVLSDQRYGLSEWKLWCIKPILRPLSDITEEELRAVANIGYNGTDYSEVHFQRALQTMKSYGLEALQFDQLEPIQVFKLTAYYLSLGFDLFRWIEQGKAISKSDSI